MIKRLFKSFLFVVLVVPEGLGAMQSRPDKIELGWRLAIATDQLEWAAAENLIVQGADPNQRDSGTWTPLMNAAMYGKEKIVQFLIVAKADLNLQSKMGRTALLIAVDRNQEKIVQILIDEGAELNLKDGNGRTALNIAADIHNLPKIYHMLIDAMLAQNQRVYAFLFCLKQIPGFQHTNLPRDLFKLILLPTLTDVRQEINQIRDREIRTQLLEKYGFQPISNSETQ